MQSGLGPNLIPAKWNFITGTWSPLDGMKLFRDGIKVRENAGSTGEIDETADHLYLGGMPQFELDGFIGRLDEVRVYNRPMDEDEVLELFELEPGPQTVRPEDSLVTMWAMRKSGL